MDLAGYLSILRARWLVVAGVTGLCVALAAAVSLLMAPRYVASASMFLSVGGAQSPRELSRGFSYAQDLARSYARAATLPVVLDPVIAELDLDTNAEQLAGSVTARAPLDAVIIEIQVSDASPARAAALANAITRQLEATVQELDSGVTAGAPGSVGAGTLEVARVAPASPPQFPAAPRRTLTLALALVFGVLGGCVLAISLDALDARVGGRQEVARVTTAPVIGRISGRVRRLPRLFALLRRLERPGEQTRQLRTNFQRVQRDRSISSVVFTSALDDAATAQTVSELAVALADTGAQVLLVDADLRRPSLARQHGTDDRVGLSQVLDGDVRLVDAVRRSARAELDVLPAGPPVFDPSNVLGAPAMVRLLAEAADRYELVLVKAAPVLRIADGLVLSPRADGVVIVADDRRFHRTALAEEVRVLDLVGARLIGVVLTV